MFRNKKVLAVIPARAGSKRLPNKNLVHLAGKPLVVWSIEVGLECEYIDRVVVSTDDEEIAEVARQHGASVPFMRPAELAADDSSTIDVLLHAIDALNRNGEHYDYLLLLQPSSPLRTLKHVNEAFETMANANASGVISVCPVGHPVEWTNTLPKDRRMDDFIRREDLDKRSQDFEKRYQLNGAIYLVEIEKLLVEGTLFCQSGIVAYVMETRDSIDIDTPDDLILAECLMTKSIEDCKSGP